MDTAAHTILLGAFGDLVRENTDDLGMDPPKVSWTSSALSLSKTVDLSLMGSPAKRSGYGSHTILQDAFRDLERENIEDLDGIMTCVLVEEDVEDNLVIRYMER